VIFEPFYENYGPDAILCDARPVFVPMPVDAPLDLDRWPQGIQLEDARDHRPTPNNPTGRVLSRAELEAIADRVAGMTSRRHPTRSTSTSYEGEHIPIATLPTWRSHDHDSAARQRRSASPAGVSARSFRRPCDRRDPQGP